ncbi:hypothetical protein L9F63_022872, partial [Diploptera punctata]
CFYEHVTSELWDYYGTLLVSYGIITSKRNNPVVTATCQIVTSQHTAILILKHIKEMRPSRIFIKFFLNIIIYLLNNRNNLLKS